MTLTPNARDRILIVENDPIISDFLSRQALQASGYQTDVVNNAGAALSMAAELKPDVIIANLSLAGLSAKDMMVALTSQGFETPVVVLARKGSEADIIQAFRLGAADYLLWPARESEIITVAERVLKQVHERRERQQVDRQLEQANQELKLRVAELTTIFSIGKAVTSITDQSLLFEKILDGAIKVSQADLGWFSLREDNGKSFLLVAHRNLPPSLAEHINQPWDDGISPLVAVSGEPLAIHGEPVRRFKIAGLGEAALITPVKAQKQVIALLIVMRRQPTPFSDSEQNLLAAVADYASISLMNARLFREVEERARSLQALAENAQLGERINNEILQIVKSEVYTSLESVQKDLDRLATNPPPRWSAEQRRSLGRVQKHLQKLELVSEAIVPLPVSDGPFTASSTDLNEIVYRAVRRFQQIAQQNELTLVAELPKDGLQVLAEPKQIAQVMHGLLSNAMRYCNPGGKVIVKVEPLGGKEAQVTVQDNGSGVDPLAGAEIFEPTYVTEQTRSRRFGGIGIRLHLIKDIITRHKGRIWVESKPGRGASFYFTLRLAGKPKNDQADQ